MDGHLASQFGGLTVGGQQQRLRTKRSQRFTVPVQSASSAPNSQQFPIYDGMTTLNLAGPGSAGSGSDAHSHAHTHDSGFSSGLHGGSLDMPYQQAGLGVPQNIPGFPPNFAQSGPSFLQQDPFAHAGGSLAAARLRTLSANAPMSQNATMTNTSPWLDDNAVAAAAIANIMSNAGAFSLPSDLQNNIPQSMGVGSSGRSPYLSNQRSAQQLYPHIQTSLPASQTYLPPASIPNSAGSGLQTEDVIPTAIVIKNIPFALPSESLLTIIEELALAPPYAFNYHYDQGVFRGLAFANFHSPQQTDACVAALNGYEIQGRKLRVEYKKVLQAGEKERIERDKAIKRMRSMQLNRERLISQNSPQMLGQLPYLQQPHPQHAQSLMPQLHHYIPATGSIAASDEWEDYGQTIQTGTHSHHMRLGHAPSDAAASLSSARETASVASSADVAQMTGGSNGSGSAASTSGTSSHELDMNDPQTLQIYSRVLLFKDDSLQDELAFSKNLAGSQRRIVHLVAQKLGLAHKSIGVGEERYAMVLKSAPASDAATQRTLRTRASTHHLLSHDNLASGSSSVQSALRKGSPSPSLRKKSMPDLRHQQAQPQYNLQAYAPDAQLLAQYTSQSNTTPPYVGSALMSALNGSDTVTPRHSTTDLRSANRQSSLLTPGLLSQGKPQGYIMPTSASLPSLHDNGPPGFPRRDIDSSSFGSTVAAKLDDSDPAHMLSKVVGSPAGLLRQPRGPGATSSWSRGSPATNGFGHDSTS